MGNGKGNVFPTPDDRWTLVEAFIREKGLVRQHIESFNDFIERRLQQIIDEIKVVETNIPGLYIKLGKIEVGKPMVKEADGSESEITPMEARLRNLTYAAPMYLTLTLVVNGIEQTTEKVYIGHLPIMVKSCKCPLSRMSEEELIKRLEDPKDPGGYFIINGSERVLVMQEDLAPNRVMVEVGGKSSSVTHTAKVLSVTPTFRTSVTLERHKDGTLHVSFPAVPAKIPFAVMMRALGLERDDEIVQAVSDDETIQKELIPSLLQAQAITTVEDALDYIGSKVAVGQPREVRIQKAEQVIDRQFLPHLGTKPEDRIKKAYFLAQMAEKLIEVALGRRKTDDKDHYANKRLRLAGDLLAQLFRHVFRQSFCADLRYQIERLWSKNREISLATVVRADILTEKIRYALATGNWVGGRVGVSQLLDRTNYLSTISHLRRVVSPLSRTQPHFEARDLHPTQWGRLCTNESPEGQNCGLVKNLALLATVSIGVDESKIEKVLYNLGVVPIIEARKKGIRGTKVYLNGRLIGIHLEPEKLVTEFRKLRRSGKIPPEVSIAYHRDRYINEISVNCDEGRVLRPLLVVENGELKLKPEHIEKLKRGEWSWSDLVRNGIVEYLDAEEEENALIATDPSEITPKHTHMEIVPAAILGAVASIIPFAEYNQSPRNSYEAAMAKQALGIPSLNYRFRMDSRMHLLHYPQRPLVTTRALEIIGYSERPAGQNLVIAVMSFGGYNMEDALIFNKASIERGVGRSTFFRTYEAEERKYPGGEEDRIEIPEPTVRGYRSPEVYAHLSDDGIVDPETYVSGGEVLIGRTSPPRFFGMYHELGVGMVRRDTSVTVRRGEKGIVDKVIITETVEGNKLVKVRVRETRIPELGDKFASRHGQKGVIGLIVPMEDMPFTEDGIVPDIIINPHAFPSRMTIGQLIETIAGKVAALEGRIVDGTPFDGEKEEDLRKALLKLGFRPDGKEVMYNGITGEKMVAEIFIGIVYYQKLHHMVADKIHARARGPVQILTRQPTEGRAREGGLRFGEMERDCLIGHGTALLLRERLLESSDRYVMYVCENCGLIAYFDARRGIPVCPVCGEKAKIAKVIVPYAFKLLLQELMSMCIMPRLVLGDVTE
ncbi:MAG: DNA-directed RNA polymerase subunit B [Thermoprotei archaeon]|nr:MAG: DNA-directed RNA polymerase subunit B [Thermoprotei archaeon]